MIHIGGVYRHYKSTGGDDHTYRVIGLARHSENHDLMVIYEPLYDASSTRLGDATFAVRPVDMWSEDVERNGNVVKRFILVDDAR